MASPTATTPDRRSMAPQELPKGSQKVAKVTLGAPKGRPKGSQMAFKGYPNGIHMGLRAFKSTQVTAKGAQRVPMGAPRATGGCPKGTHGHPKGHLERKFPMFLLSFLNSIR